MRMTKRTLLGAGLALLTTPILGVPAARAADSNAPLVIGTNQVPRHFNGAIQSGLATGMVSTQLFASPLRYDDKWNPQPYLAKSWDIAPDNLSVTLHLVRNAVFHDGHPLTAEDVAFSIGVIKANHPFQSMLEPVSSVETPDPYTVVIRLARPHPALLLAMSPGLMPIIPKHVYGDGQDIKTHPANLKPVGSGPFRFIEYKQGEAVTLARFDKFFIPDRPKLDRLVFRILPDSNSLVIAAEQGEIGMMPFLSGVRDIERLSKSPSITVTDRGFEGIGPTNWLAFNTGRKPLDDVRVRRALALAANRDFITGKLLGGVAKPASGPIVPGSPFYEPAVETFKLDVGRGREAARRSGTEEGLGRHADVAHHRLHPERQRSTAQRRRVPAFCVQAHRRGAAGAGGSRFPDLGTADLELRIRPHDGQRVQLGRSGDRRRAHLPVIQHPQGRDLVQHSAIRQSQGGRATR